MQKDTHIHIHKYTTERKNDKKKSDINAAHNGSVAECAHTRTRVQTAEVEIILAQAIYSYVRYMLYVYENIITISETCST